jgi:putative copper resistance protein D
MPLLTFGLGADGSVPLDWSRLGVTQLGWVPSIMMLTAGGLYLWGAWRIGRLEGSPWSRRRTGAFFGGLVVTFAAIEGVVGAYDDQVFYAHMIQHLMLVMVAGPLFAMGAPLDLLQRASSSRVRGAVDAGMRSRVAEVIGHPIAGFVAYAVLIPFTHLTSFYNYTLTNDLVHDAEHLGFLVVGYLFWRPVVGIEPSRHPLSPALQLLYLALAVPVDTFTGLALTATTHELFSFYNSFTRGWGPSLVTDLHIGGSIMWVGGDTLMFIAMIPVATRWVRVEEQRTRELDAALDRIESGGGSKWSED